VHRAVVSVVLLGALLVPAVAYADRDMCRRGTPHRGAPVDLDVKDADIHDVMRLLADVGNVNIVVADSVQGKVTLKLKRVAWDLVACTIASLHKLQITAKDNVVLVTKPPK
jgi:type II secretory pathway component HofQ